MPKSAEPKSAGQKSTGPKSADPKNAASRSVARDLLQFIAASPSPFHAVEEAARRLESACFTPLDEAEAWSLRKHGRYFVTRNGSSVLAFIAGGEPPEAAGLRLVGAHTDSPCLKLKPEPLIERHGYLQFGVEVYGGTLHNSWLDRELGLAGRVVIATDATGRANRTGSRTARGPASRGAAARGATAGTSTRLVHFDAPVGRIPQLAIHLDREVNEKGLVLNRESHLVPIVGLAGARGFSFRGWLGEKLGVGAERVLDHDLVFFDRTPPTFFGLQEEFLSSPRLDNLASSFAALSALIATRAEKGGATRVVALYDNEEIGSATRQGADGSFLEDLLERILEATGDRSSPPAERSARARARSLFVSADMAHAVHPNYADRNEERHRPRLNAGPVIKYNANARYATDAASGALFQTICREARVPFQKYVNRADLACGSTIGPIVSRRLGTPTVDVGCPQLAMHSAREMAGAADPAFMVAALARFFVR